MAADKGKQAVKAGAFVAGALAVFAVMVFFIGEKKGIFTSHYLLRAYFQNVSGLIAGAAVRLQGIQVGNVERIELPPPGEKKRILVVLKVDRKVQKLVTEDSTAHVETMGVLGDKYIEISIGGPEKPRLEDGAEIKIEESIDSYAALQKAGEIIENVRILSGQLKGTMSAFQETNTFKNLDDTTASVRNIVREVETGGGLLHALIYESEVKEIVTHFAQAMKNLDGIVEDVRTGEGTAHTLIYGTEGKRLLENLASATGELDTLVTDIRTKEGTLHSLVYTEEGKNIVKELDDTARSLKNIMARIEAGEGSLGALIKDPSLYNDLVALLQGVQRSKVLQTLIDYGLSLTPKTEKPAGGSGAPGGERPAAGEAQPASPSGK